MAYVTRFAPSPTGPLHLGHAFSALTAHDRARAAGGQFLLRIEDIDPARSKPEWEAAIHEDLAWLGLDWPRPVLRQSERLPSYRAALSGLAALGVLYPCRCRRGDIRAALSAPQEGVAQSGPDGLIYPGLCRGRPLGADPAASESALGAGTATGQAAGPPGDEVLRLDIARAARLVGALSFEETGPEHEGLQRIDPARLASEIGDVVLARRDFGTSYHLSVVVDDAAQGVTEAVRGLDLFEATPIHVLLQALLGLPRIRYHHHRLVRDESGKRLAKRDDARALARYRAEGMTPADLRRLLGLPPAA